MRHRRIAQLSYHHRVVVHRFGDPSASRVVLSTAPLTRDGIRAVIHWRDAGGDRYALVASRGAAVEYEDCLLGEVSVVAASGGEPAPSRWRLRRRRPSVTRHVSSVPAPVTRLSR